MEVWSYTTWKQSHFGCIVFIINRQRLLLFARTRFCHNAFAGTLPVLSPLHSLILSIGMTTASPAPAHLTLGPVLFADICARVENATGSVTVTTSSGSPKTACFLYLCHYLPLYPSSPGHFPCASHTSRTLQFRKPKTLQALDPSCASGHAPILYRNCQIFPLMVSSN